MIFDQTSFKISFIVRDRHKEMCFRNQILSRARQHCKFSVQVVLAMFNAQNVSAKKVGMKECPCSSRSRNSKRPAYEPLETTYAPNRQLQCFETPLSPFILRFKKKVPVRFKASFAVKKSHN